jgi:hypothetical protein
MVGKQPDTCLISCIIYRADRKGTVGKMLKNKDQVAHDLAAAHAQPEGSVIKILRVTGPDEDAMFEPIKLLEVNVDTVADGIVPVFFGPDEEVPYPSVVIDVTPDEFRKIQSHELQLPQGWEIADLLYEYKKAAG